MTKLGVYHNWYYPLHNCIETPVESACSYSVNYSVNREDWSIFGAVSDFQSCLIYYSFLNIHVIVMAELMIFNNWRMLLHLQKDSYKKWDGRVVLNLEAKCCCSFLKQAMIISSSSR
jgi:hypothetical protein